VQDGTNDVRSGVQGARSDVRSGAQVRPLAQLQVRLPAQVSNSTGSPTSPIETRCAAAVRTETADVAARPFALSSFLTSAILQMRPAETGRDNRPANRVADSLAR